MGKDGEGRRRRGGLAAIVFLAAAWMGAAWAQPQRPDAVVLVHGGHFASGGQAFPGLDALQAAIGPRAPQVVGVFACGAAATGPWLVAAYRFRHLHLDLRVFDAAAPECGRGAAALVAVAARGAAEPAIDATEREAARRWWAQTAP